MDDTIKLESLEAQYEMFCKSRHEIVDPLSRTLPPEVTRCDA